MGCLIYSMLSTLRMKKGKNLMQKERVQTIQLVAPACVCCPEPVSLVPRPDLPGALSVCPQSGQLYRPEGTGYVQVQMPVLPGSARPATSVRVDLSAAGYA